MTPSKPMPPRMLHLPMIPPCAHRTRLLAEFSEASRFAAHPRTPPPPPGFPRRGSRVLVGRMASDSGAAMLTVTVWVRRECLLWDRGPYHWTRECVDGRALVELDRRHAQTMSNLRPCKLCAGRDRRGTVRPAAASRVAIMRTR